MSYKVRNSILLGVLVLLIVGVGTYVRAFHMPKKERTITAEIKKIDEELSNTPNLIHEYNTLSETVAETKKRWESRNKEIPPEDLTGKTYDYFSGLIEKSGGSNEDAIAFLKKRAMELEKEYEQTEKKSNS